MLPKLSAAAEQARLREEFAANGTVLKAETARVAELGRAAGRLASLYVELRSVGAAGGGAAAGVGDGDGAGAGAGADHTRSAADDVLLRSDGAANPIIPPAAGIVNSSPGTSAWAAVDLGHPGVEILV